MRNSTFASTHCEHFAIASKIIVNKVRTPGFDVQLYTILIALGVVWFTNRPGQDSYFLASRQPDEVFAISELAARCPEGFLFVWIWNIKTVLE